MTSGRIWSFVIPIGALLLLTLVAYYPAWHGGFLWDDDGHITRAGLRSLHGLWRIWFEVGATQQYYPLVHSAFWFMHRIWGDDTFGYHLVNIVLHTSSAVLFAMVLRRLAVPGAFLAAAIFAVHPIEVESVAWMTELKNTLSGALYLASALAYLDFDTNRRWRSYGVAAGLFAAALLSKTVTATLPAALLVIFWWQRGRLRWREDAAPLLPFFATGAAAGLVTAWFERTHIGATGVEFHLTIVERVLVAGRVIWFYLAKLLWPANLMFVYPRWTISGQTSWHFLYPLGVVVVLAGVWWWRSRSRAPLAVALLFIGTLAPALGFVNVYPFIYSFVADHFQYLAGLSLIAALSAGLTTLTARWRIARARAWALAALLLVAPATVLTWQQSQQYADAETLYRITLARNPACWMAHNNLGVLMSDEAKATPQVRERLLADAVAEFQEALRIGNFFQTHANLGAAWLDLGRLQEAQSEYRAALQLKADIPEAHNGLGLVLAETGHPNEAIVEIREALRERPDFEEAHDSLGNALQSLGKFEDAIAEYGEALRLNPNDADAHNNLGSALLQVGRLDDAVAQFEETLRLNPLSAQTESNLGDALMRLGRDQEAAGHFVESLRLRPDPAVRVNLERALRAVR